MTRARRALLRPAFVALVAFVAARPVARAYEERLEISLGLGPNLILVDGVAPGGALDVFVSRGLSDHWSLGGSLRYSMNHRDSSYDSDDPNALEHRLSATADATWALDIVQWIPRLTLAVGPSIAFDPGGSRVGITGSLRIGADRITGFGLFGIDARVDAYGFLTDVVPGRLSIGLAFRVGWLIDRF